METKIKLFELDRHECTPTLTWDEEKARLEITLIVDSVALARQADGYWSDSEYLRGSLFLGSSGILWAIGELAGRGYDINTSSFDIPDAAAEALVLKDYEAYFDEFNVPVSQSLLMGPVGTLILAQKQHQSAEGLDNLEALIRDNQSHPWMENLWGAPSTMLAASHLYRMTREERFADQIRSGAAYLWDHLEDSKDADCQIWDILLYGRSMKFTGAGHGFIGNIFPVICNLALFSTADQKKWIDLAIKTVATTAIVQDGLVNWPPLIDKDPALPDKILLHQCHGAPGFVIGLISLFGAGNSEFDDLLLGAGELVWIAGPLKKYPCLCHGTPGNSYVFLKLWQATGDKKWLSRARAFAMSAIDQRRKQIEAKEQSVNSLWEGDMGLAMCLADCIEAKSDFPILDYF